MFKGFNLKDSSVDNITFMLMKNINEPYSEIPKDYVKNINRKHRDCSTMTIEIPNKIFIKGIVQDEKLYDRFLGKHQQIILESGSIKERYVITQCERTEEVYKGENGKKIPYRVKKIECKSYEYTLTDKKFISSETLSRQLYYDKNVTTGAIDISDGYLNFVENETNWRIKYVSTLARKEFNKQYNEYYTNINNATILNMAKGTTIWEKAVVINPIGQNVVNLKVSYTSIKNYSNNVLTLDSKKIHDTNLNTIYTGVKNIKAVYDGNDDYRYAIHYIITLSNNEIIHRWEDLNLFLDNQKVIFTGIILAYENGSESEISNIKNRSLELGTYGYLDLLRNTIENAFDIILVFDTYNMEISAYDKSELGENKGIEFSYETFIKSINKKDQYDNIINKLSVSSDNTSIVDENPFGTSYILDYTYHYNNGLMSEELMSSWDRYLAHIDGKQADLYDLRINKNTYNKQSIAYTSERTELDLAIRDLLISRVDYIKTNTNKQFDAQIKALSTKINTKQTRFETLMTEIQNLANNVALINEQIKGILKDISLEGATDTIGVIFNSSLLEELDSITIEDVLEDSFYTVGLGLFNYSKKKLSERNKLNIEFSITPSGILQNIVIPNGVDWNYYINVGDFVSLATEENDISSADERGLRIVEIDYSPCDVDVTKITLSNSDEISDDWSGASNIGHAVSSNTSYINNYKPTLANSVSVNSWYNNIMSDGMDLKAQSIKSRSGRVKFSQSEAGMYIIDNQDSNSQLFLGAGITAVTADNWLTLRTCVDAEGVVAQAVYGKLLVGERLIITTELGDFFIGDVENDIKQGFGLTIQEQGITRVFLGTELENGVRIAKLRLTGADGGVCLSEEGILQRDSSTTWGNTSPSFPVETYIDLDSGVSRVSKATLKLRLGQYRGFTKSVTTSSTTTTSGASSTSTSGSSSISTSGSSNNTTTSYADNHKHIIWQKAYGWSEADIDAGGHGLYYLAPENTIGGNQAVVVLPLGTKNSNGDETLPGNLYTFSSNGGHVHSLEHVHSMGHYHNMEHVHSLNLNLITQVQTGIKLFEMASNVSIKINGQTIMQNINSNMEIDITAYLKLNTDNKIEIHSATNGYIGLSTMCKYFSRF